LFTNISDFLPFSIKVCSLKTSISNTTLPELSIIVSSVFVEIKIELPLSSPMVFGLIVISPIFVTILSFDPTINNLPTYSLVNANLVSASGSMVNEIINGNKSSSGISYPFIFIPASNFSSFSCAAAKSCAASNASASASALASASASAFWSLIVLNVLPNIPSDGLSGNSPGTISAPVFITPITGTSSVLILIFSDLGSYISLKRHFVID
jgi:hypothetical protein